MKKLSAISVLALSGLALSAAPALADSDNGGGHTPVTFCHGGKLHTNDENGLNGHKNHAGDVFAEDLGRPVTAADCAIPIQPEPEFPSGNDDITYQCDAVPQTRTDHIVYTRIDFVYDEDSNSWVRGPAQVTDGIYVFPISKEQADIYCPTPPVVVPPVVEVPPTQEQPPAGPVTPPAPEVPATPEQPPVSETPPATTPESPAVVTPPAAPVKSDTPNCTEIGHEIVRGGEGYLPKLDRDGDGTACEGATGGGITTPPASQPSPTDTAVNTGTSTGTSASTQTPAGAQSVEQAGTTSSTQQPSQLANTGFNWVLALTGLGLLGAGIFVVRRTRTA
jgi:hypothetical protein